MGIITVNWYCNASYQFHLVKDIAPAFDFSLVPEKFRLVDYKNIGANPIYFQEAANPKIYKPYNVAKSIDVSFAGSRYGDRTTLVNEISKNDININVYGNGWKQKSIKKIIKNLINKRSHNELIKSSYLNTFHSLSDLDYIKLYSRSKINLGFSSCGETHNSERILQIKLRDFEAPMSGAFYMTEYQPEIEDFFLEDKEIVCYKSNEELINKIKYYLKNQKEREKISLAGYKRAKEEHSWQKRFKDFFNKFIMKNG
jgi:spore maturation protein CgeB